MPDVICPWCAGSYHETTSDYLPDVATTGNMLRLKEPYRSDGWSSFPEDVSMSFGSLECPACGGMYCGDDGIVETRVREDEVVKTEEVKDENTKKGRGRWKNGR